MSRPDDCTDAWRWQQKSEYGNKGQGTPAVDGTQPDAHEARHRALGSELLVDRHRPRAIHACGDEDPDLAPADRAIAGPRHERKSR